MERKRRRALRAQEYTVRQREVAKLIHEGMESADAQDSMDARPLKYPESCSDEEEEESGSLRDEGSGSTASLRETSGFGSLKRPRDDAAPEPTKRLRDEGLGAPEPVSDGLRDNDCALSLSRGGAGGPPSPDEGAAAMRSPPASVAVAIPSRAAVRT